MSEVAVKDDERNERTRVRRRSGSLAAVVAFGALAFTVAAQAAASDLTQKPGTAGCISETGTGGQCINGLALNGAVSVTVSPDGESAYVASNVSDAVTVFDRNTSTGALTQKPGTAGCISETGTGGQCTNGVALDFATSITVSPDGESAYLTSLNSNAVAVFDRNTSTGALIQKAGTAGCISETGTGGACTNGVALDLPSSVTVSPDGKSAYVASGVSNAVAVFDRNTSTGALTQKPGTAGCISETGSGGACTDGIALNGAASVTVSPDGKSAYVASGLSGAVAVFDRNTSTGALTQKPGTAGCVSELGTGGQCTDGLALSGAISVTVSPDGKSAYVASTIGAVAIFDRNTSTGALTQKPGTAGCIADAGTSGGACTNGVALKTTYSVTVAPDGSSAYVASLDSNAVAIFYRNTTTGALTQKPGTTGCISETGTGGACTDGVALAGAIEVTVSPDGKSAYVASALSDAVAVFDRSVDTVAEGSAKAKKTQKQKGGKIVVVVKVKAEEDLEAKGKGAVKLGKKSYRLKSQSKSVPAGKKKSLKLKPKKSKHRKKIADALKKGKQVKAKLKVKLSDPAGNAETTKPTVKLKHR